MRLGASGKLSWSPWAETRTGYSVGSFLLEKDDDPLLLVLAADHVIADQDAFTDAVKAIPLAEAGKLVTFGIVPSGPHTGYGYIEAGEPSDGAYSVASFKEKPDADTAANYVGRGGYYWNSGMFLFKAGRYLKELQTHKSDIAAACKRLLARISQILILLG